MTSLRRYNSPVLPLLVASSLAALFVVLRWLDAAHRQLGEFVVAGVRHASPALVPKNLPVKSVAGYDGQFYYRLALDPFDLRRTAFGIRLDSFSRVERMGYPFLAWVVAHGQHTSVPLALVIVNVAACGVVALAGGMLAMSADRHALWGLVFAGYWGYLWTLGRDLTELTAAAFVLLGLAALVRRAPIWGGLSLLCAVLSKETSVLLVGTLAVLGLWVRLAGARSGSGAGSGAGARARLVAGAGLGARLATVDANPSSGQSGIRGRISLRRFDLAYMIPLAGFVIWQVVLFDATGHVPIFGSGGQNLGIPFVGIFRGLSHYLRLLPSTASILWVGELCILTLVAVGAASSLRTAPVEIRALWVVSLGLALTAATGIWLGDVGFRSLDDLYLMGWLVLLYRRGPIWPWAVLCGGAWVTVFVELVRYV